jgi:hypothetical protein
MHILIHSYFYRKISETTFWLFVASCRLIYTFFLNAGKVASRLGYIYP